MTVNELKLMLKLSFTPHYLYDLAIFDDTGFDDDCVCMRKNKDTWEVFESERGNKYDLLQFKSESDACKNALERIRLAQKYL